MTAKSLRAISAVFATEWLPLPPENNSPLVTTFDQPPFEHEWEALTEREPSLHDAVEQLGRQLAAAGLDPAHLRALGTIGGGNHFAELQVIDEVQDAPLLTSRGLASGRLQLLVHSGSRGLGQAVLRAHVEAFSHAGLEEGGADANAYLAQHAAAVRFAELNRQVIAARIFQRLRCEGSAVLDVNHNTVLPSSIGGQDGWLHRKGATPSDTGLVMLPGSRDAHSYLLEPVTANGEISLHSLAHGAGRKWQRSDCKDRLFNLATPDQLSRTGIWRPGHLQGPRADLRRSAASVQAGRKRARLLDRCGTGKGSGALQAGADL